MRTIALRISKSYVAGVSDELLLDTTRYKETVHWTRIVGLFDDGRERLVRLFVKVGGTEIILKQETVRLAGDTIESGSSVYLSGDYRIGMRVFAGDAGGLLELSAFGVVEDPVTVAPFV